MLDTQLIRRQAAAAAVFLGIIAATVAVAEPEQDATMTSSQRDLDLLFIHHSCGGQLFADPGEERGGGPDSGEHCIYVSHPNGGGLRGDLVRAGYRVHEASYGSLIGEDTDLCHWRNKFATQMDRILRTFHQDELLPDGEANDIVCFKSCFPNNHFTGRGQEPGDPDACEVTVANAKAVYASLLPHLRENPEVLFVAFTAPPMAAYQPTGLLDRIKGWFGGHDRGGALARDFSAWLADRDNGWLAGYELPNVVVFDHYGVLTAGNDTGYSAYPTRGGHNSHPSSEGNRRSAAAFVPLLEAAVAAMGWTGA